MKCAIAGCTRDATPGFQRCEPCANGVPVPSSSAPISAHEIAAIRAMLAQLDEPSLFGGDGYGEQVRRDATNAGLVCRAAPAMLDEIERLRAALDAAESALAHLRSSAGHAASVAVHGDPLAGAVGTIGPRAQR